MEAKIAQAVEAIRSGFTRGRFIRENTKTGAPTREYQEWSDAYTHALQEIERDEERAQ